MCVCMYVCICMYVYVCMYILSDRAFGGWCANMAAKKLRPK